MASCQAGLFRTFANGRVEAAVAGTSLASDSTANPKRAPRIISGLRFLRVAMTATQQLGRFGAEANQLTIVWVMFFHPLDCFVVPPACLLLVV